MTNFNKLMKLWEDIVKVSTMSAILGYDEQVGMPSNGASYRGDLSSFISTMIAKKLQSKKFLSLIDLSKNESLSEDQKIILNDIEECVKYSNRIPVKLHGKISKQSSVCHSEWEKVKQGHSDKAYLNSLEKLVDLIKESVNHANKGEFSSSYDYLLNGYSKGFTTDKIESLFSSVSPFVDSTLSKIEKTEEKQFFADDETVMKFCRVISNKIHGAEHSVNLAKSTHPFCTTLGRNDIRITTRIKPGNILDSIGSTVHESGHATYEAGLDPNNYGNALGSAASIAAHEGISLFYEKHIGEHEFVAKMISEYFGYNYDDVISWMRSVDSENLIRTESDEITYQKHIINRFTIEKELFNGNLSVNGIPARWNELYGKTLTPAQGYACDVHWAGGSFGYFPSYSIGHMIGAQLKQKMMTEIEMVNSEGLNFEGVRSWLKSHYFCHGARYNTPDLIKVATGEELDSKYWINYISEKFNLG